MAQLRELDLQPALGTAGALREDVDDQLGPVGDPQRPEPAEVALLDRADRMIEDDQLDLLGPQAFGDPLGGPAAQIERGVRPGPVDDLAQDRVQAGGPGERIQLIEAVGFAPLAMRDDRDERDARRLVDAGAFCRAQLAVLSGWKSTGRDGTTVEIACL